MRAHHDNNQNLNQPMNEETVFYDYSKRNQFFILSTFFSYCYCCTFSCFFQIVVFSGYFYNLDPDPEPGPWTGTLKTWTLKNLDPEKPGINMGLKNMSDFRQLCFIKTMRNVIYCLKVRVLTDI